MQTKWRVVVTCEMSDQYNSGLRREVIKCLEACGITQQRSQNTWEGKAVPSNEAAEQLGNVLKLISNPSEIKRPGRVRFDHLWVYVDRER